MSFFKQVKDCFKIRSNGKNSNNRMKKCLSLFLAASTVCLMSGCSENGSEADAETYNIGSLRSEAFGYEFGNHSSGEGIVTKKVFFDNLTSMLLALEKGDIDEISTNRSVAEYITAHNENFKIKEAESSDISIGYAMMTLEENTEIRDLLNSAIREIKNDGTMTKLIENDLSASIDNDPTPAALPVFDDGQTISIAITGDLPPMDFMTVDGKAAGFNIALLTEIANRAKINFEPVTVETGARTTALSSGKADALFWTDCTVFNSDEIWSEPIKGTIVTDTYLVEDLCSIIKE